MPDIKDLSGREFEILNLVATGKSNKEIAQELFISANTVKVHLRNIFAKLEVSSRTEASVFVLRVKEGPGETTPDGHSQLETTALSGTVASAATQGEVETPAVEEELQPSRPWQQWGILLAILTVTLLFTGAALNRALQPEPTQIPESLTDSAMTGNRWEARSQLLTSRSSLAVTVYENNIYVVGGENAQGVLSDMSRFRPEEDSWATLASKPTAVADVQAAIIGGKIYVPGGRLNAGEITSILEIYDPRNDVWEQGSPMPGSRSAYALVTFEGQLYLFGGWNGHEYVNSVYAYNPNQDQWDVMTPMSDPRGYLGAVVAGGKIFVFGGYDGERVFSNNDIYLPERDRAGDDPWEEVSPLPDGRYAMGSASVADAIYVIGGESEKDNTFSQMKYSPRDEQWEVDENPLADTWSHLGVVPLGTQLYALGGLVNGNPADRNLVYQVLFVIVIPVVR